MPPILTAYIDLEAAHSVFMSVIHDYAAEAEAAAWEAQDDYDKAGGDDLPEGHPALVAYDSCKAAHNRWCEVEDRCVEALGDMPSLRDLGLGANALAGTGSCHALSRTGRSPH